MEEGGSTTGGKVQYRPSLAFVKLSHKLAHCFRRELSASDMTISLSISGTFSDDSDDDEFSSEDDLGIVSVKLLRKGLTYSNPPPQKPCVASRSLLGCR